VQSLQMAAAWKLESQGPVTAPLADMSPIQEPTQIDPLRTWRSAIGSLGSRRSASFWRADGRQVRHSSRNRHVSAPIEPADSNRRDQLRIEIAEMNAVPGCDLSLGRRESAPGNAHQAQHTGLARCALDDLIW